MCRSACLAHLGVHAPSNRGHASLSKAFIQKAEELWGGDNHSRNHRLCSHAWGPWSVPDTLSVHGCLREQIYGLRFLVSYSHYSPTRRPIAILLAMWLCDVAARATSSHVGCRKRVGAHNAGAGTEPRISHHLPFLAQTFIFFFFPSCGAGDEVKIYVLPESNLPRPPHLFSLFP